MPIPAPSDSSTALVTGASSGIGEQFARQLSARGHHVTLVARRRDRLEALAAELGGAERATVLVADLGSAAAREGLGTAASDRDVEVLVNAAGFGIYSPFRSSDRSRELAQVRVLVEAVTDLTHRHFGAMCSRGRGAIINISSTSAFQPLPYNAGYAAAKAYVLLLSEALHAEGKEDGVTVTAVCPGPVPTEFQTENDARFAQKLPKALWVTPERTAADSLRAADAGKRMIIPGGPMVQAAFGPNRFAPTMMTNPVTKRLMAR